MAVVGTAFRDILKAMKAVIVGQAILPDGDCFVTIRMNPPANEQKKCLIIVPLYQMGLPEIVGHSRCSTYKKARINVYYRHISALDETYQDDAWALDDDGYYAMIDKLEDAFDLWHPRSAAGAFLLNQPARLIIDNEPRKNYRDHTLGEGMIELEVEFTALRTV